MLVYICVIVIVIVILLSLFFIITIAVTRSNNKLLITTDPSTDPSTNRNKETIFVSIASYRDSQCPMTIKNLYDKADHPELIYVGLIQQNADTDADCEYENANNKNIPVNHLFVKRLSYQQAEGPTMARYLASQLYQNQDFFLEIDSHMRFLAHWDTELIKYYHIYQKQFNTDKIVLSHYPLEYNVEKNKFTDNYDQYTTSGCNNFFNQNNIIQPGYQMVSSIEPPKYYRNYIIGCQMLFGPRIMVKLVPFDPDLSYLFHGEELLYSVRLFCAGFIILSPPKNLIFHYYGREKYPKIWTDNKDFSTKNFQITQRVGRSLLLDKSYGSGVKYAPSPECVKKFYQEAQIDIHNKKVNTRC